MTRRERNQSSRPVRGLVAVPVVMATILSLTGCGADDDTAVAATTTEASTDDGDSTEEVATVDDQAAETGDPRIDQRLAFLVGFLDEPDAPTAEEIAGQFTPTFLAVVPPETIRSMMVEVNGLGQAPWTVTSADTTDLGGVFVLTSTDGVEMSLTFEIEPGDEGRIDAALLVPGSLGAIEDAFAEPGTIEEIDAALDAVAPDVTYAVFDAAAGGCEVLRERNSEVAAPIGSSFKLWVLATLARAVRDGDATWDETIVIDPVLRSSPDGEIYELADGTPVTLQRLAELMISISDNTATDHLIARLGRPAIEATMTELGISTTARNTPFLSTGELFTMKYADPALADRFLALDDPEDRRALLDGDVAATPLPWIADPTWTPAPELAAGPRLLHEIEWFATPADLCVTLNDLDALAAQPRLEPVAAILEQNPGLPFPEDRWSTIRFKGGSEVGLIAFAYWLETPTGERRVVAISLSDPDAALDEDAAVVAVARLIALDG